MLQEMNLTQNQTARLKEAIYKIADAQAIIAVISEEMELTEKWNGLDDMLAIRKNLNDLVAPVAGGVGCFLEEL